MCAVFGWTDRLDRDSIVEILKSAKRRGRDGWGIWADGLSYRGIGEIPDSIINTLTFARRVVGNFRATPTTELETSVDILQPYDGLVHNGTIANDKDFGDFKIDSMCLPLVTRLTGDLDELVNNLKELKGSFALAYFVGPRLIMAANYKPIYYGLCGDALVFASQPYMLPSGVIQAALSPYSVATFEKVLTVKPIPRRQSRRALVACSAGLDSTTVAYKLKKEYFDVTLVHFDYGCKAGSREFDRIQSIAKHGDFKLVHLKLPSGVMAGSIVDGTFSKEKSGLEGAEYAVDWVSARNLLMLSMLTAYAEANDYGFIAFGGNLEESGAYPDNEEEFANKFNQLLPYATQNGVAVELLHPLTHLMKHEIVSLGGQCGVPFELTWSCYGDGDQHCGECGPCYMRKNAFTRNGLKDPVML